MFDYADLVLRDKNNATIMNDLQIMQKKAAKIISDKPLYSSATDALTTLKWLKLGQRRHYHRCLYVFKCINKLYLPFHGSTNTWRRSWIQHKTQGHDTSTSYKNKLGQTEAGIPGSEGMEQFK